MNNSSNPEVVPAPPVQAVPLHQPPVQAVPLHQPPVQAVPIDFQQLGPWSTGLCDCFDDKRSCCFTCLCPSIAFQRVADIVDKGATYASMGGLPHSILAYDNCYGCIYTGFNRTKMRKSFGLEESPCQDMFVHGFCKYCAICQEYRELQNRGYDLKIGWEGNLRRQAAVDMAPSAPPVVEGGMMR